MAAVPANTVYSFLSELGPNVTQEPLPAATPGRPRKIYTLTGQAVETLLAGNFEVARVLREAGIATDVAATPEVEAQDSPEGQSGMKIESLWDLYAQQLKDLYSTEKQILQALPRKTTKAQNEPLRKAFENHVHATEEQLRRLDRISKIWAE